MTETIPGVNVEVADEPTLGPGAPTNTDTTFLISTDTDAPVDPEEITSPAQAREAYVDAPNLHAAVDSILNEATTQFGGSKVIAVKLGAGEDALTDMLAKLPKTLGPGQIVAPAIQASADIIAVSEFALDTKRVYLANGPAGASDAALATLADTIIDSGKGRNTALFKDTAIIPGFGGGGTRTVPWSVVEAGLIARNDLLTGNPNLAAAGDQGICVYALGIDDQASDAEMTTLNGAQVNVARAPANGAPRAYGYRTLADLDILPQWFDLGGSRTVMDLLAHSASSSERIMFGQIDSTGGLLAKWNGLLATRCLQLLKLGALYGNALTAFKVDTGPVLNPVSQQAEGRLRAALKLKTSPYAEALDITIIRQPITAA